MATSPSQPPQLTDPTPNRIVLAVHRHLSNEFQPAVKNLADSGLVLLKALQAVSSACSDYSNALQSIVDASINAQPTSKPIGSQLSRLNAVIRDINNKHDQLITNFASIVSKTNVYSRAEKDKIKELSSSYAKEEKALMKHIQKGVKNKTHLERFYFDEQHRAVDQQLKRFTFVYDRHCEWLRNYADLFSVSYIAIDKMIDQETDTQPPQSPFTDPIIPNGNNAEDTQVGATIITYQPANVLQSVASSVQLTESIASNSSIKQSNDPVKSTMPTITTDETPQKTTTTTTILTNGTTNGSTQNTTTTTTTTLLVEEMPKSTTGTTRKSPLRLGKMLITLHDFAAASDTQLSLHRHDMIKQIRVGTNGWAFGQNQTTKRSGWFPISYTKEEGADEVASSG